MPTALKRGRLPISPFDTHEDDQFDEAQLAAP